MIRRGLRSRQRAAIVAVACGGLALIAGACGGDGGMHLEGSLELRTAGTNLQTPHNIATSGTECAGKNGYDDIGPDAQVVVAADGRTVGLTTLGRGRIISDTERPLLDEALASCRFSFALEVERGHDFYTVTVGRRGSKTYSGKELAEPGALDYQLGN